MLSGQRNPWPLQPSQVTSKLLQKYYLHYSRWNNTLSWWKILHIHPNEILQFHQYFMSSQWFDVTHIIQVIVIRHLTTFTDKVPPPLSLRLMYNECSRIYYMGENTGPWYTGLVLGKFYNMPLAHLVVSVIVFFTISFSFKACPC